MAKLPLLRLIEHRPVLCDGATGTRLIAAGLPPGTPGERWNLDRPDSVAAVHRQYREAGADVVTTNTMSGTIAMMSRHGLGDAVDRINRDGALIARRAAGDDRYVLGDMGPFGDFLEPVGTVPPDEVTSMFTRQARALLDGHVDGIIVETMADPAEMALAIRAARSVNADWPVVATYAFGRGAGGTFRTMMGSTVREAMSVAIDAGADVVGANCGIDLTLEQYVTLAGELVAAAGPVPVVLQPNAGAPKNENGVLVYAATAADFAAIIPAVLKAGVRVVGGCCGTTPDHIRAASAALRSAVVVS